MTISRGQGIVLVLVGIGLVAAAVAGSRQALTSRRESEADVARLQVLLDSARAALATATTSADSTRIAADVRDREYYLGRRAYHVARPAPSGVPWRRPFGPGTVILGAGVVLTLAGGAVAVWSAPRRRGSS